MTSLCQKPLRIALFALLVACGGEPLERQPCPAIGHSIGTVYEVGVELRIGDPAGGDADGVAGDLPVGRFAGHPLAVPLDGDLTLSFEVRVDSHAVAASLYGPRRDDGLFGGCVAESLQVSGGAVTDFSYYVPVGRGGEYLLLAGTNPSSMASGGYTVSVTCSGLGCGGESCPVLLGSCKNEFCPGGFSLAAAETAGGGDLRCRGCECAVQSCGPFEELVVDRCVCACKVPDEPAPVCGTDGVTYLSSCFAGCAGVASAREGRCEDECPTLSQCDLECERGLKVVDGCKMCECRKECEDVSGHFAPVCGTDGFSYTNEMRMRCEAAGVEVAYLGPCLPYCQLPGCALACEHGYVPRLGTGDECFECACMEAEDVTGCEPDGHRWCAFRPGAVAVAETAPAGASGAGKPDEAKADDGSATAKEPPPLLPYPMARYRTFIDKCTPKAHGWKQVFGATCPTGVCSTSADCKLAEPVLDENLDGTATAFSAGDGGEQKPMFACNTALEGTVGVCMGGGSAPLACDPADGATKPCPKGATCVEDAGIPAGGRCHFACACLNKGGGRVYDPVCATEPGGGQKTFFNACMALCKGAWPIDYPGRCCEPARLPVDKLRKHYLEVDALCKGYGLRARVRLDTACPPQKAKCEEAENKLTCCVEGPEDVELF